jgi:hypothetical protein
MVSASGGAPACRIIFRDGAAALRALADDDYYRRVQQMTA